MIANAASVEVEPAPLPTAPELRPVDVSGAPTGNGHRRGWRARARRSPWLSRKRLLWMGVIAAVVVAATLLLRPDPALVETGVVTRGPLEMLVEEEGVTAVRERFDVTAPVAGRLERPTLREGDVVERGAIIARIAPLPLDPTTTLQARAQVDAARAGTLDAAARVAQVRAVLAQVERDARRSRELLAVGAISAGQAERAELELGVAQRDVESALAAAAAADAGLLAARAALTSVEGSPRGGSGIAIVRSPSAGRVLRVHHESEGVVAAGTPIVEIGDARALEVVVNVLSTEAVRIRPGTPMRIVEWGGDDTLEAAVRLVEPAGFTRISTLGVEEQRVNVIADVIGAPPQLGDRFRVEAQIVTWSSPDVVKVPNSALFRRGEGWALFVVVDGRAHLRSVQVGHRGVYETELLGGVAEGDRVVRYPSDRIEDGLRVTIESR